MKNVCIVSAVGHYENAVKYLSEMHSDDENYLIIYMYSKGVIPEKILTQESSHFWNKIFVFEPEKNATSGMNTVKLNATIKKYKEFASEIDLLDVDQVFLGVLPVLPMYNYLVDIYSQEKINLIEDGTASYMLGDSKLFEYLVAPNTTSIKRNKKMIKKKVNRKENGLMLLNTMFMGAFSSTWSSRALLNYKRKTRMHFNKIILSNPEMLIDSDNITFEHVEKFDFGTFLKPEEIQYNPEGIPIYFDQNFGVPVDEHVQILDDIFKKHGVEEVVVKLHPKSRQSYIDGFLAADVETNFILELGNFSGEELLRQECPPLIFGLNSTVLLNAKDIVDIKFILNDYFDHLDQAMIENNYYRLMFMNHTSYNLEKIINKETAKLYPLKCSKLVLTGFRKPVKVETLTETGDETSAYVKKLEKGVRNYMIGAMQQDVDAKRIFFEAYKGMYACSPKQLYLYMKNDPRFTDYSFVWSRSLNMDVDSFVEISRDPRTKVVNLGSADYFEELAKAKLIITNQRLHKKFFKKDGQSVLQTWHGTPFKKDAMSISVSTHNVNNDRRIEVNHHDVRNYDYFLVQNEFSAVELSATFMLEDYPDVEVLKVGYPRNNTLVKNYTTEEIDKLKEKYSIPKDKKVLFYTPTWRDHHKTNKAGINDIFDFAKWQEALSDEWVILFRGHYFHAKAVDLSQYQGFIYDTTQYNDINDFYIISDLLVTDYSSSYFDFLNLKRPILFYMPDYLAYIKLSRKLHFEPETDLPGPVTYRIDDFLANVKDYELLTKPYMNNIDDYIAEYCPWDKDANENVISKLIEKNVL